MMQSNSRANDLTLIIGAGAAGLAAGRALHDAGRPVLIVEARDRIGGRIQTDDSFADFPVELGAEFIHGEGAATHDLLRQAGLGVIPVDRRSKLRWGAPALPRQKLPEATLHMVESLLAQYAEMPTLRADSLQQTPPYLLAGEDISLREYFRSRGWDEAGLQAADVLFAQTCCTPLDEMSCADFTRESWLDTSGKEEFRVREGYKALLEWYSRDLPIRLNTPISEIRRDKNTVSVVTAGETLLARRCIVTLPVSLLQRGAIRFDPPLSEAKQRAIAAFRMPAATKLLYRFREPMWDEELTFMAHTGAASRWWTPGYGHPGAAVICAFLTAERAQRVDAMDEAAALELGLLEMSLMLDIPLEKLRANLVASRRVSWANDPYAYGGYAHLLPGASDARPALAQPEGDTLFFAGEATAWQSNPQTVHGALESGWRAARECGA